MYNIINKDIIYVQINNMLYPIGDERTFIRYLAKGYRRIETFNGFWYNNDCYSLDYYDGYYRHINSYSYQYDAWRFYNEHIRPEQDKNQKPYWSKNKKKYHGIFRQTPVPYTAKRRGGPRVKPRKIKHIAAMYGNPEYKDFNRGSRKDYPNGWWDDWSRNTERSWKDQSKRRHQWR